MIRFSPEGPTHSKLDSRKNHFDKNRKQPMHVDKITDFIQNGIDNNLEILSDSFIKSTRVSRQNNY